MEITYLLLACILSVFALLYGAALAIRKKS